MLQNRNLFKFTKQISILLAFYYYPTQNLAAAQPLEPKTKSFHWASYNDQSEKSDASDVWLPITSFFLPGTGQWFRGQNNYAPIYTGTALAGLTYAIYALEDIDSVDSGELITSKNFSFRKYLLGLQTYQAAGGMSLYHTFRSAVWQRQKHGEYSFLGEGDAPLDIMMAPFNFNFLTRSSTWIPLAIVGGLSWYIAHHPDNQHFRSGLSSADPFFAGGFSYNAGTHEEATFRGWVLPIMHEAGFSKNVANLGQASIFALAHLDSNKLPLPQFFLGLHLGNTTMKNNWSITEAVFIHVWWDVFAFLGIYSLGTSNNPSPTSQLSTSNNLSDSITFESPRQLVRPSLHLPPLLWRF